MSIGETSTYSLGSGASVVVPAGKQYIIKYCPVYVKYTVVEEKYQQQFVIGFGMVDMLLETKTCEVDVFSHWNFTVVEII